VEEEEGEEEEGKCCSFNKRKGLVEEGEAGGGGCVCMDRMCNMCVHLLVWMLGRDRGPDSNYKPKHFQNKRQKERLKKRETEGDAKDGHFDPLLVRQEHERKECISRSVVAFRLCVCEGTVSLHLCWLFCATTNQLR